MSHTTTISAVKITDEAALVTAIEALRAKGSNIELKRNAIPRLYFAHQSQEAGVCDYVIGLPGTRFDVGLKKNKDGVFTPIFDEHANIVHDAGLGASCALPQTNEERAMWAIGAFSQEYAKAAAINAATAAGYYVESATTNAKGEVELIFTGM